MLCCVLRHGYAGASCDATMALQARVLRQRMQHLEAQNRRLKARWTGGSSVERASSRPKSPQKPGVCRSQACSTRHDDVSDDMRTRVQHLQRAISTVRNRLMSCYAPAGLPGSAGSMLAGNPRLAQWEEQKRLQKRIDGLRGKVQVLSPSPPAWAAISSA